MLANDTLSLGVVDDHKLFRKGLVSLIKMVRPATSILFEADNGLDMQKKIAPTSQPDIILMDVNMPGADGFESVNWLSENYPQIKILVISMVEREESIVRMLKLGVRGYLCKDVEPQELGEALDAVALKGYYYTDFTTGKLLHSLQSEKMDVNHRPHSEKFNSREIEFLRFACSELTYVEIADKMFLSPKTIDGYRNALFEKLAVKNRVGLAIYAIRNNIVKFD